LNTHGDSEATIIWAQDFRWLNTMTNIPRIPLPLISELLDAMGGCKYISTIDLQKGYHQMRVTLRSCKYTAFYVYPEIYKWLVTPIGVSPMPGTWSRLMRSRFNRLPYVMMYLDGICVFSTTLKDHAMHLRSVLQILRSNSLYASPHECVFAASNVEFLGHIISASGVQVDTEKVVVIQQWPAPRKIKELQRFLGLTGYYRRFIKDYTELVLPFSDLLKKITS